MRVNKNTHAHSVIEDFLRAEVYDRPDFMAKMLTHYPSSNPLTLGLAADVVQDYRVNREALDREKDAPNGDGYVTTYNSGSTSGVSARWKVIANCSQMLIRIAAEIDKSGRVVSQQDDAMNTFLGGWQGEPKAIAETSVGMSVTPKSKTKQGAH